MKKPLLALLLTASIQLLWAQPDSTGERKGFKKENLFAGGSVSLSFGSNFFLGGVNPMLGYNLTKWADAGVVVNYIYSSYKDYYAYNDKLHQNLIGGGAFVRLFPVRFLFLQGQIEQNFINQKYIPSSGGDEEKYKADATSFLVGAGYTTGRQPGMGGAYGYFSLLVDVMNDKNSPYIDNSSIDNSGSKIPIIRAGLIVPLFQGQSRDW